MQLDPPLALLLGVAGGLLQYIRQFARVPDWVYHLLAVGLTFGLYVLVTPTWATGEWRDVVIRSISWLAERVPTVWGGTFVVSNAAKYVAGRNGGASSPLVPLTDSK